MKKIVLIGDSIRMGYDKYVKEALKDTAQVYYPDENCKFSQYVLRFAHSWKEKGEWPDDIDLVHWNAGLWDVIEIFGDEPLSTLAHYENIIPRVDKRLRELFPNAKMVFATSTAVAEQICNKNMNRHNSTIKQYNDAAVKLLKESGTVINNLFELTLDCPVEYHSDGVHYNTDIGRKYIGDKVVSVICNELGIKAEKVDADNFRPENYDKTTIAY